MEKDMKKVKDMWQEKLLNKKDEFKDIEVKLEDKINMLEAEIDIK